MSLPSPEATLVINAPFSLGGGFFSATLPGWTLRWQEPHQPLNSPHVSILRDVVQCYLLQVRFPASVGRGVYYYRVTWQPLQIPPVSIEDTVTVEAEVVDGSYEMRLGRTWADLDTKCTLRQLRLDNAPWILGEDREAPDGDKGKNGDVVNDATGGSGQKQPITLMGAILRPPSKVNPGVRRQRSLGPSISTAKDGPAFEPDALNAGQLTAYVSQQQILEGLWWIITDSYISKSETFVNPLYTFATSGHDYFNRPVECQCITNLLKSGTPSGYVTVTLSPAPSAVSPISFALRRQVPSSDNYKLDKPTFFIIRF